LEIKCILIQISSLLIVLSLYSLLLNTNFGMDKSIIRKAIRNFLEFYPILTLLVLWGYFIYEKIQLNIDVLGLPSACAAMALNITAVLKRLYSKSNCKNEPNS
jgi:hypothetical protein